MEEDKTFEEINEFLSSCDAMFVTCCSFKEFQIEDLREPPPILDFYLGTKITCHDPRQGIKKPKYPFCQFLVYESSVSFVARLALSSGDGLLQ